MTRRRLGLAIGALLLSGAAPLVAQAPVKVGDRIRVQGTDRTTIGRLLSVRADTLLVETGGPSSAIVVGSDYTRLERSLGIRGNAGTGLLVGAAVGAAITGLFLNGFCGGDTLCDGDEQVRAAVIFGVPSLVVGGVVGALVRTERWTAAGRPAVTVGFIPTAGTPNAAIGIRLETSILARP